MKSLIKIRKSIMLFVKIMIVAAVTVGFIQVWITNYAESLFSNKGNYVVIFSFVLLFSTFHRFTALLKSVYRVYTRLSTVFHWLLFLQMQ